MHALLVLFQRYSSPPRFFTSAHGKFWFLSFTIYVWCQSYKHTPKQLNIKYLQSMANDMGRIGLDFGWWCHNAHIGGFCCHCPLPSTPGFCFWYVCLKWPGWMDVDVNWRRYTIDVFVLLWDTWYLIRIFVLRIHTKLGSDYLAIGDRLHLHWVLIFLELQQHQQATEMSSAMGFLPDHRLPYPCSWS